MLAPKAWIRTAAGFALVCHPSASLSVERGAYRVPLGATSTVIVLTDR